jgi:hypothetical protein
LETCSIAGKEAWLRGSLAKWLMDAGFKGRDEARKVLPRVMALGPEQPTVFRMDMAQAGRAVSLLYWFAALLSCIEGNPKMAATLHPLKHILNISGLHI